MSTIEMTQTYQPRLSDQDHLALLKRAIAANLDAREEHDRRQERAAQGKSGLLGIVTAAQLEITPIDQLYLKEVIDNPVRRALKSQLKDLGWRLYRLLRTQKAMLKVADEIANMKPQHWDDRINIIDKNWDGIGKGSDVWWA
jgi:hypothetical protein